MRSFATELRTAITIITGWFRGHWFYKGQKAVSLAFFLL